MKSWFHTLKQYFKVEGDNIWAGCAFLLLGGIAGMIISAVLLKLDGGQECVPMGAMMAAIVTLILGIFLSVVELSRKFNLAISMGKTRKELIFSNYVLEGIRVLLYLTLIGGISRFEVFLLGKMYPGVEYTFVLHKATETPAVFLGLVVIVPILVNLFGALFMRYGQKFYWVFWVLWMVSFTVGPRLFSEAAENPDSFLGKMGVLLISFFENVNRVGLVAFVAAIGAICVFITVKLLRKQWVTL